MEENFNLVPASSESAASSDWLIGNGSMAALIRSTDWKNSPLGAIESWPHSLRMAVNFCLASNFPTSIAWGENHTQIYNDQFMPICGNRHPDSLGQDFRVCWASAWPVIGEAFDKAWGGEVCSIENQQIFVARDEHIEEMVFTLSFSPIADGTGKIVGLLHSLTETTRHVLSERRWRALRDLAAHGEKAESAEQVFVFAAETFGQYSSDFPFALFYMFDKDGNEANLVSSACTSPGLAINSTIVESSSTTAAWPLSAVWQSCATIELTDLKDRFGQLSCGAYPDQINTAILMPIMAPGLSRPAGVLVVGLNPRLVVDDLYRGFCNQIAIALSVLIANARANNEKLTQKVLRQNEERYRFCLEASSIGAWEMDLKTRQIWRSRNHDVIYGYPSGIDHWTSEIFFSHVIPEDRERVQNAYKAALTAPDSWIFECRIRRADGAIRSIVSHGRVIKAEQDETPRMYGTIEDVTEKLKMKESLQQQTDLLQMILNGMSEGVIVCSVKGELILINKSAEEMLNMDGETSDIHALNTSYEWRHIDETEYLHDELPLVRALKGEKVNDFDGIVRSTDKNVDIVINGSATPLKDSKGNIVGALNVFRDVTASRRALQDLHEAEQHFKLLVEGTTDYAIFMLDANGHIVSWNPGAQRILGYESDEVIGRHVSIFYTSEDIAKGEPQRKLRQTVLEGRAEEDSWRVRKDGHRFWSTGVLDALHDDQGHFRGFVEIMRDNTERRLAEENNYFLANHDPLTGLLNRARFMERLHEALLNADRDDTQVAVLLLDLNRFKLINDTLGHHVGDMLLKKVAYRLSKCVRETDTVARLGGDEFVVILTRLKDVSAVEIMADKIIQEMGRPHVINRQEVRSGTSLGIAVYRQDGSDASELLQKADLAMYRAKSSGHNHYKVFTQSMLSEVQIRREQEDSLRHALDYHEFELSFQPQIDLRTFKLSGAEVLLRNRNRVLQAMPTNQIIKLAEETGMIIPLGEWILRATCRQMKKWQQMGLPEFKVSINFSSAHLLSPNFLTTVRHTLADTGLDAKYLEFEVTEGVLVAAGKTNSAVMTSLKEIGVSISIDDFGTGFSALSYLKDFPVDVLKLDESLVHNLPGDLDEVAIVSAIMKLALDLKIKVIAEGVETVDQLAYLKTTSCSTAQGFLFSPAIKSEQFEALLIGSKWSNPVFH